MNRYILSIAAVPSVLISQNALAATQTTNMAVTATVSSVCTVSTVPMAFGEVATSGTTTATADVTVLCTAAAAYTVGLGNGLHAVSAQRNLQSGTNTLAYGLFKEGTHTNRWGDTGTELRSGTGTSLPQTLTAYGLIPAGQTLQSGNGTPYTDTILVTITY